MLLPSFYLEHAKKSNSNRCPLPSSDWDYSGSITFNGKRISFTNLNFSSTIEDTTEIIGFAMFRSNWATDVVFGCSSITIQDTMQVGTSTGLVTPMLTEYTCTDVSTFNNFCVMYPAEQNGWAFAEKINDNKYKISLSAVIKVHESNLSLPACKVGLEQYSSIAVDVDIVVTRPL